LIVSSAAGGSPDIVARLIGQWLSERLRKPFIIENRAGAGSNIGTESVVRAATDGHTLLLVTSANAINTSFYENLNFVFQRDIAPVAGISRAPCIMEVLPSFPATTVAGFIAHAKANPGKVTMASGGNGTIQHVSGELFKMMAGIDMLHVPYRSVAPAISDLLGGQVQVMFNTTSTSIEYVKANRLRALAVTSAARLDALPETPALNEVLPGFEASGWLGVGAPRNTPADIVDRLNNEINAALANPEVAARLVDLGNTTLPGSPAHFDKLIADETEKWAKVVKFAGLKPG
jgi:tripartite-type tricarboxylate transporter receptor subunit TctC